MTDLTTYMDNYSEVKAKGGIGYDPEREKVRFGIGGFTKPEISGEIEPLVDVTTSDKEVKVVVEMPGVSKDKIKANAYDNKVEVKSEDPQKKYHRTIEIPPETDIETAKSAYNNGILEITFSKKEQARGKAIKVE